MPAAVEESGCRNWNLFVLAFHASRVKQWAVLLKVHVAKGIVCLRLLSQTGSELTKRVRKFSCQSTNICVSTRQKSMHFILNLLCRKQTVCCRQKEEETHHINEFKIPMPKYICEAMVNFVRQCEGASLNWCTSSKLWLAAFLDFL
jgi:hypothetical protein